MAAEKQSDWLLVAAAIIIIAIFGGGYRMGMSGEANSSKESLTTIKSQERATAKLVRTCNDASATFTSSDKDLQAQIDKLRGEVNIENVNHDWLYQANGKKTDAVTTCVGEMETQAAAWEEEDIKYKDKIAALTMLNKGLVAKIDALANSRGQPRNYLNQALDRVRWENVRMRIKLKMIEMPAGDIVTETTPLLKNLEEEIVQKYAGRTENITGVLDVTPGENATYSGRKRATFQFQYNKTKHNNIFMYQKMEDGHLKRPVFFGRDGTNPIDQGVTGIDANVSSGRMHKKYMRMASIPRVFKSLYNYALCAYRNNNQNITFPDVFLLKPPSMANVTNTSAASKAIAKLTGEPERAHASALFDTPLLTFCRDCKHMSNTSEFKLACLGDTVDVQYGSYDFWAMRSMLRWNPLAYEKAQAYLSGVSWGDDKPYIGVVYRTDQRTLKDCQRYKKPQRHYLYLAKNQPANRTNMLAWSAQQNLNKTATHGNTTVELPKRSEPACAVSYAELMKNMAAVMTRTGIKRFYISTKHNALASLKKRVAKVFGNDQDVEVEWQTPRMNQPEEQLTDLVVLESSQYLLIDAFTEHSQVVAESYLIRNEFNTDKLFVM